MRYDKFEAYWQELGKPPLEYRDPLMEWASISTGGHYWLEKTDYRLAGDAHWEMRRKWVDSDKTLSMFSGNYLNLKGWEDIKK